MAVMPRESWTDERLDDFRGEVNRRFDETNSRLDRRIDETNRQMEAGFAECREEFQRINDRLDALQRTLTQLAFVLAGGLLGVIAALLGLIATQL